MPRATLAHLVDDEAAVAAVQAPFFCRTQTCEVVYFDASGRTIPKQSVQVVVFSKDTSGSRPVCYCFGHSVAEVMAANDGAGSNTVVEAITEACRQGLDRCEQTNPEGRCCLANVRRVAKLSVTTGQ